MGCGPRTLFQGPCRIWEEGKETDELQAPQTSTKVKATDGEGEGKAASARSTAAEGRGRTKSASPNGRKEGPAKGAKKEPGDEPT